MSLTESIKEELDRDCAANKDPRSPECITRRYGKLEEQEKRMRDCWLCNKHDPLAARIADRVEETSR